MVTIRERYILRKKAIFWCYFYLFILRTLIEFWCIVACVAKLREFDIKWFMKIGKLSSLKMNNAFPLYQKWSYQHLEHKNSYLCSDSEIKQTRGEEIRRKCLLFVLHFPHIRSIWRQSYWFQAYATAYVLFTNFF